MNSPWSSWPCFWLFRSLPGPPSSQLTPYSNFCKGPLKGLLKVSKSFIQLLERLFEDLEKAPASPWEPRESLILFFTQVRRQYCEQSPRSLTHRKILMQQTMGQQESPTQIYQPDPHPWCPVGNHPNRLGHLASHPLQPPASHMQAGLRTSQDRT